jgi:hypothetical protein
MKKVIFVLTLAAMWSLASLASADQTDGVGVYTMKPIVIVGRPNLPSVVIELTRPTAAQAARSAHEEMRNAMIESLRPATLSH